MIIVYKSDLIFNFKKKYKMIIPTFSYLCNIILLSVQCILDENENNNNKKIIKNDLTSNFYK